MDMGMRMDMGMDVVAVAAVVRTARDTVMRVS